MLNLTEKSRDIKCDIFQAVERLSMDKQKEIWKENYCLYKQASNTLGVMNNRNFEKFWSILPCVTP